MSEAKINPDSEDNTSYTQTLLPIGNELRQMSEAEQKRRDKELEKKFPNVRYIFDQFLYIGAPRDVYRDIIEDLAEFPVEAVLAIQDGNSFQYLAREKNQTNRNKNSLDHAEKAAIEHAFQKSGVKHLGPDSILISSVEPCSMCASAFLHAGGKTIIYGASQQALRGHEVKVGGLRKQFRTEPASYHIEDFLSERDPSIKIYGGYREPEVVSLMNDSWDSWSSR